MIQNTFEFPMNPKYFYIYRNNSNSEVSFVEHPKLEPVKEQGLQLLGCFQLKDDNKKQKLLFYSAEFIKNLEREDLTQSG